MSKPTSAAFFSYSRQDSEFAQKLAQDLRSSGASVWLDQLDIRPGQRWDRTVQDAVTSCPRMLVVLSPSSVDSENVMDEVSFALERKKTVIPVLYRDCDIPFRLGRVQYIDFRTDYDRALKELVETLNALEAEQTPPAQVVDKPVDHAVGATQKPRQEPNTAATESDVHRSTVPGASTKEKLEPEAATESVARSARPEPQNAVSAGPTTAEVAKKKWLLPAAIVAGVLIALALVWMASSRKGGQPSPPPSDAVVKISPSDATLAAGETAEFSAQVTGASDAGVTWSLFGDGDLSDTGVYTAPKDVAAQIKVTVKASSKADPSKYDTASVILKPARHASKSDASASRATSAQGLASQSKAAPDFSAKQRPPSEPSKNAATAAPTKGGNAEARGLQLAARASPIEGTDGKRFRFSLSVRTTGLSDIAKVQYDLVYAPNPLLLSSTDPTSNFTAVYEGWGCYRTVNVTLFPKEGSQQPIKKTFDLCTVLGW
jgi:hypothetical protein